MIAGIKAIRNGLSLIFSGFKSNSAIKNMAKMARKGLMFYFIIL